MKRYIEDDFMKSHLLIQSIDISENCCSFDGIEIIFDLLIISIMFDLMNGLFRF